MEILLLITVELSCTRRDTERSGNQPVRVSTVRILDGFPTHEQGNYIGCHIAPLFLQRRRVASADKHSRQGKYVSYIPESVVISHHTRNTVTEQATFRLSMSRSLGSGVGGVARKNRLRTTASRLQSARNRVKPGETECATGATSAMGGSSSLVHMGNSLLVLICGIWEMPGSRSHRLQPGATGAPDRLQRNPNRDP